MEFNHKILEGASCRLLNHPLSCRCFLAYSQRVQDNIGVLVGKTLLDCTKAVSSSTQMKSNVVSQRHGLLRDILGSFRFQNYIRIVSRAIDFLADGQNEIPILRGQGFTSGIHYNAQLQGRQERI